MPTAVADGAQGEIETSGAARQIGNHQHGYDAEDSRADAVQDLYGHEQDRIGSERVEDCANRKHSEGNQQQAVCGPMRRLCVRTKKRGA